MKVTKRIRAVRSCFCKPGTVRILPFHPFVMLLLPNQKNEHVLQPDSERPDFTGKHAVRTKQAGHFPLFNCPTLAPNSSNHKDSQDLLRNTDE
jgi:hypothetical protein